jgi:hypothetical protein
MRELSVAEQRYQAVLAVIKDRSDGDRDGGRATPPVLSRAAQTHR